MRKAFCLAFFLSALGVLTAAAEAQTEKKIASIRAEVQLINRSAPRYTKKTKNLDGVSTEGAEATYFTSGRGLKKIIAKIYGETGRSDNEYFYRGEELIFAYQRHTTYDRPIGSGRTPKAAKVEETRAYFDSGECIRILIGKTLLKPGTIEWDEALYSVGETSFLFRSGY